MPKMMMKKCHKQEPPHPCDPKPPCDICDEGDECPKPSLCVEKIKNAQLPYETRCKPGEWMPAEICKKPDPPHPCDPPPPCKPGKPRKLPCPDPPLCKERINNLEDPYIRCPEPEDIYSEELCENLDLLRTPIPQCTSKQPCPKPVYTDPFTNDANTKIPEKVPPDPKEYLYSRELCKNYDLLKQTIKVCFATKPCRELVMIDPFGEIDPESKYPEKDDPCDEGLNRKKEKEAKLYKPCCDITKPLFMGRRPDKDDKDAKKPEEKK